MRAFAAFAVAPGVDAQLVVKTVVATGPVRRFVVGDPAIQVIDVLAGATLDRLAAAEQAARQGEIVVDEATATRWRRQLVVDEWRTAGDGRVAVLAAVPFAVFPPLAPAMEAHTAPARARRACYAA